MTQMQTSSRVFQAPHRVAHLRDPYLRAMITNLVVNDRMDVLDGSSLPVRERGVVVPR